MYNTYRACRIGPRGVVVLPVKPNQALALLHLIHFNHGQSLAFSVSYGWWWCWCELWKADRWGKAERSKAGKVGGCLTSSIYKLEFSLFKNSLHIFLVLMRLTMVVSRMIQVVIQPSAIDWRVFLHLVDFSRDVHHHHSHTWHWLHIGFGTKPPF